MTTIEATLEEFYHTIRKRWNKGLALQMYIKGLLSSFVGPNYCGHCCCIDFPPSHCTCRVFGSGPKKPNRMSFNGNGRTFQAATRVFLKFTTNNTFNQFRDLNIPIGSGT